MGKFLDSFNDIALRKAASILGIERANVVSVGKTNDSRYHTIGIDLGLLGQGTRKPDVSSVLVISASEVNTRQLAIKGLEELRELCDPKHCVSNQC